MSWLFPRARRTCIVPEDQRIHWPYVVPFALVHVVAIAGVLWISVSWRALVLCAGMYYVRMFGLAVGYHRYFAHRTFRTSRVGQFLLALLASTAAQKGPLWWAGHHRNHHRHSDTELDVHSPSQRGFWWAHVGWIFCQKYDATDFDVIKDYNDSDVYALAIGHLSDLMQGGGPFKTPWPAHACGIAPPASGSSSARWSCSVTAASCRTVMPTR